MSLPSFSTGSVSELQETALASAQRAVQFAPSSPEAHISLALAYRSIQQVDAWRQEAEAAIGLNPRVAEAWELLADWYRASPQACRRGYDPALAERHFRTALRIDPRFGLAWGNLVYHTHWARTLDEAVRVGDEAVRVLPIPSVRRARSTALLWAGRLDEAESEVNQLEETAPGNLQDKWVHGTVALMRGDRVRAETLFAEVVRSMPTTTWFISIGRSYLAADDVEHGLSYLDKAVALDPSCGAFIAVVPALAKHRQAPRFQERLAAWKKAPAQ